MGWKDRGPEDGYARGRPFSASDAWWHRFTELVPAEMRSEYIRVAVEARLATDFPQGEGKGDG